MGHCFPARHQSAAETVTRSAIAAAYASSFLSPPRGATNCIPAPSANGNVTTGVPAKLSGTVYRKIFMRVSE